MYSLYIMESLHKRKALSCAVYAHASSLSAAHKQRLKGQGMSSTYNLKCPVARTLDIIGERWTILILRDLFVDGPRKFQDFEQSLSGASATTLSTRLKKLEENGSVARRLYVDHPPRAEYILTDKGRTLGPLLKMLLDWGTKHAR